MSHFKYMYNSIYYKQIFKKINKHVTGMHLFSDYLIVVYYYMNSFTFVKQKTGSF